MSGEPTALDRPSDRLGAILYDASRWLALFGGLVLSAVAVMITVSVTGRFFFAAPVPGDIELTELGTGVGIFAFLPWCQITRQNVIVDFFMDRASDTKKRFVDALGSLTYGVIMTMFAWRTTVGGLDIYDVGEATYFLNIPRWTTFPFAVVCLILLVAVCAYTFRDDVRALRRAAAGRHG